MARFALEHTGPSTGIMGGLIAYIAATTVVGRSRCCRPRSGATSRSLKRDNARWFAYSGVFVAAAQGFFFAAVSRGAGACW